MSFVDQKPQIATQGDINAPWGGSTKGKRFRCHLCGHKFQLGDQWRWVRGKGTINFKVCRGCDVGDDDDLSVRMKTLIEESEHRFWWVYADLDDSDDELHKPAYAICPRCKEEFRV